MTHVRFSAVEKRNVLIASSIAIFINPMMGTMMNLALTAIGIDFNIGAHDLGWITTIFFLLSVTAMVPFARLADIHGKKKIMIIGLILVTIFATASALAPNYYFLLLFRGLTGVGTAAIAVTSTSMIAEAFEAGERGRALGLNTAFLYIGMSIGPMIGGFICDTFGWRSIFIVIIPLALIGIFASLKVPSVKAPFAGNKIDTVGSIYYMIAIILLSYGMVNLPAEYAFICMGVGAIFFLAFVHKSLRTDFPVLEISLFKNRMFTRSVSAAFLNYAAAYSVSFFVALYLCNIGNMTPTTAGLVMMIQPIIQALFSSYTGRLSDRLDKRLLPTIGMVVTSLGLGMLMFLGVDTELWYVLMSLATIGIGFALFSAPNTAAVMSAVKFSELGEASALLSTLRQAGIMASMGIAMCCISIIMGSLDILGPDTYNQFLDVIKLAFGISVFMCVFGAVISWFRGTPENAPE